MGLRALSGQVRKITPPPGLDPGTIQPVASRYTDWATRPQTPGITYPKLKSIATNQQKVTSSAFPSSRCIILLYAPSDNELYVTFLQDVYSFLSRSPVKKPHVHDTTDIVPHLDLDLEPDNSTKINP